MPVIAFPTIATSPETVFTRDVLGRYICNGLDEALNSTDVIQRVDALPFDIIIIGGGTFGSALAQEIFFADIARIHRILVLEAGPFLLTEHTQNLPMLGLFPDGDQLAPGVPKTITNLRNLPPIGQPPIGQDKIARNEVWGLAWHSAVGFPGLAYCTGGRSLYWGGWSPQFLDTEMPGNRWPAAVVNDLNNQYFANASEQIGVDVTNDFIFGPLHEAMRAQLLAGIDGNQVTDAIPLDQLPLHLVVAPNTPAQDRRILKLEAPLAVQSRTKEPGQFPINKFSAVPLLIEAARSAYFESGGDNVKKRLMVVPYCHVIQLSTAGGRVDRIITNLSGVRLPNGQVIGDVLVPPNGRVIIALGTIESARLALLSFGGIPNSGPIGQGLMAHLRSNLTIRIPRGSLNQLDPAVRALQVSALFVKGRHDFGGGRVGHFHLQITATGLGVRGTDAEAELYRKVPDIDTLEQFRSADDTTVVIAIRAIGEMESQNPLSSVVLHGELDENQVRRALVSIVATNNDQALWNIIDQASDEVARIFAGNNDYEVLVPGGEVRRVQAGHLAQEVFPFTEPRRDRLGSTHHEAGGLIMGTGPNNSVTNPDGRFHSVNNAYALGPCLHPTVGSCNPMLTGIALARRMADHLTATPPQVVVEPGFQLIFDGTSTNKWRMSTIRNQPGRDDPGTFIIVHGALQAQPGTDIGLFWYADPMPADYILKLQWMLSRPEDNSGIFVRFPHPDSKGYNNTAFVGVDFGFEVQIDELGMPDGLAMHRTGAIYNEPNQAFNLRPALPPGQWNDYEIHVQGQNYTVILNNQQVTQFQNPHAGRGLPSTPAAPSFIGLQTHTGRVSFRAIRFQVL